MRFYVATLCYISLLVSWLIPVDTSPSKLCGLVFPSHQSHRTITTTLPHDGLIGRAFSLWACSPWPSLLALPFWASLNFLGWGLCQPVSACVGFFFPLVQTLSPWANRSCVGLLISHRRSIPLTTFTNFYLFFRHPLLMTVLTWTTFNQLNYTLAYLAC